MHSCMFLSPVNASSDSLHIYLAIVSVALLGVGRQGGLSSHMFTPDFWSGRHMPIWLFCFTMYSTPWIFSCAGFSAVSDLDIHLRVMFRSWGPFDFSVFLAFSEGVLKLSENISVVPTRAGLSVLSDLLGGLRSCHWVFNCLTPCLAAFLWDIACPLAHGFLGGSLKLSEGLLHNCEQHYGKYSTCLLFSLSCDGEGFNGLIPFSPAGFLCSRIYSCSVSRRG